MNGNVMETLFMLRRGSVSMTGYSYHILLSAQRLAAAFRQAAEATVPPQNGSVRPNRIEPARKMHISGYPGNLVRPDCLYEGCRFPRRPFAR